MLRVSLPPWKWGDQDSLREVARENFPGIFSEVLLEDGGQGDHGLPSAELWALHHALLVVDEEVSTAGEYSTPFVSVRLRWALGFEICHKPVYQLTEVSRRIEMLFHLERSYRDAVCSGHKLFPQVLISGPTQTYKWVHFIHVTTNFPALKKNDSNKVWHLTTALFQGISSSYLILGPHERQSTAAPLEGKKVDT